MSPFIPQPENPLAGSMPNALVPRRCKIIDPWEVEHLGPEACRYFLGPVGGAGVDDDDFIGDTRDGFQAGGELGFFVADDEAKGYQWLHRFGLIGNSAVIR
jgi:hypothetical protein